MFVAGYFAVWAVYGLAAYGLYRLARRADRRLLRLGRGGRWVAGGAIALAGAVPAHADEGGLPQALPRARSTTSMGGWRNGRGGAVRMGVEHGAYCVGCCWGLMLVLFALGVMSLTGWSSSPG